MSLTPTSYTTSVPSESQMKSQGSESQVKSQASSAVGFRKAHPLSQEQLLKTYGQFYKTRTVQKVIEAVKKIDKNYTCEVSSDLSRILVENVTTKEGKYSLNYKLQVDHKIDPFLALFSSENVWDETAGLRIAIQIKQNDEDHFYADLMAIAMEHQNPVAFLIDHQGYWSFRDKEVIAFLTKPENLEKPDVMDTLESVIKSVNKEYSSQPYSLAVKGLGAALKIPSLKARAKALLVEIGALNGAARDELGSIIDESDVKALFEKIAKEHSDMNVRIDARNYLEKIAHRKHDLEVQITHGIISTFGSVNSLSYKAAMGLEYFLWQESAPQSLTEVGMEKLGRAILQDFLSIRIVPAIHLRGFIPDISKSVPLYSILKFIGVHTTNQKLFSDIVNALAEITSNKDLGGLESLESVLAHLQNNKSVKMPATASMIAIKQLKASEKVSSPILVPLYRESEFEEYKWRKVNSLVSLLESPVVDPVLKKMAIRHCSQYLFTEKVYGWTREEYKAFADGKIIPCLMRIAADDKQHAEVRKEASDLLTVKKS